MSMERSVSINCFEDTPLVVVKNGYEIRSVLREKYNFKYAFTGVPSCIEAKSWVLLTKTFGEAKTTAKLVRKEALKKQGGFCNKVTVRFKKLVLK